MHTKTIRPGLTAATAAGRALLAAGWRYDSTSPMADDTTIRTLLHPSGREIHARTVDREGDDTTTLTMTGLTLEQAAGAVTGAGLAGGPAGERPVCAAAAAGVHCSPACYRSRGKDCETPLPAKSDPAQPQTREIKARYLAVGMSALVDGFGEPLTVAAVDRRDTDAVAVSYDEAAGKLIYGVEEGVTVVGGPEPDEAADDREAARTGGTFAGKYLTEPRYMSCPRECGVDVREHNSSDLVDGHCDTDVDPHHVAIKTVMAGIAAGLPIPRTIYMPTGCDHLNLKMADNDQAAVDAWVAHFNLALPKLGSVLTGPHRPFQPYGSEGRGFPLADWSYEVESFVDVPTPEDPEKAALAARVAELEAQLAQGGEAR